eukprot:TRINITY_DN46957_c0_g1_i1.p1 TRINITY_DN46957_c0_g1~~TRINITY_DN46957_c0_g1_i1.p1  ORF type:complete len:520 (+),score=109.17 TRINITY_DN46957_c0_g1_i1:81-1640(+)
MLRPGMVLRAGDTRDTPLPPTDLGHGYGPSSPPREEPPPITDTDWYEAKGVSRFSRDAGRGDPCARFDPFPTQELGFLQGRPQGSGPGRFYDVCASYQRAVLPACHSPVLRGDPAQARMRSQRAEKNAEGKLAADTAHLDLDPRVDFLSHHLSPRSYRFGPQHFTEGQRSQRFNNAAFTDPPELFAYGTVLFEKGFDASPVTPRKRLIPDFLRTTGRSMQPMNWQTRLPQLQPNIGVSVTEQQFLATQATSRGSARPARSMRRRSQGQGAEEGDKEDTDEDTWVDQYIPQLLKTGSKVASGEPAPRMRSAETDRSRRTRGTKAKARPRGAELHLCVGREVTPTFMRLREPKQLTEQMGFIDLPRAPKKRSPSPAFAQRPFKSRAASAEEPDTEPPEAPARPPLSRTGAALGSEARRGMCDVDSITRSWARRHKRELLAQEADQAAEGSPPAFSVRELLAAKSAWARESRRSSVKKGADKRKGPGALDLYLGCGRGDDVRALVGNPSRSYVAKIRRQLGV